MSSSDRRAVLRGLGFLGLGGLALGSLALGGCGFTPVYGPTGQASRLQNAILPDAPQGRDQYLLIQRFEERLGRGVDGPYALGYAYGISGQRMAVTGDNVTTRINLVGRVDFVLRDRATDAVLLRDSVEGFTGYSTTGSTSATEAAGRDAHERLATLLADQMVTRLILAADRLAP
ncbi:MAG: LPS assembly lipoprotein LptE [Rhodobacterales bacterium]|nr:LPS assembly lipoprotein LptE [Rhodobacterales bacterium]MDX5389724.1 LPS assembly lipoprotein LptE [Rhodobacterales bacterium]MDX5489421.1 LPS assembly lipoprotein LptE [Rhodobacterales bacterium]